MAKRSRYSARKEKVAGSIPDIYIYFYFEFFACFPSLQVGGALANEIKQLITVPSSATTNIEVSILNLLEFVVLCMQIMRQY